jgi:hypothetical protein
MKGSTKGALIGAAGSIIAALIVGSATYFAASGPSAGLSPTPTPTPTRPRPETVGPHASVVTVLMAQEATAATAAHAADAIRLYAATAFVRNAGCLTADGSSYTWQGLDQILQRYIQLPQFASLRHVDAQVRFIPDNERATKATATAQTVGFIKPSPSFPEGQSIHGNEAWTFICVNRKWLISSFTYNECVPPG